MGKRNVKKLWQARVEVHYQNALLWRKFAQRQANELTNASVAVLEYEAAMGALLDEVEEERDVALAECTFLADILAAFGPVTGIQFHPDEDEDELILAE